VPLCIFTPPFLFRIWPSTRDLCVGTLLKFGGTYSYNFRLHQSLGDHGRDAHNKPDLAGRPAAPMTFPIGFDEGNSEGGNLVNLALGGGAFSKHHYRRAGRNNARRRCLILPPAWSFHQRYSVSIHAKEVSIEGPIMPNHTFWPH